ncbi:MAG: M48 family metallopeptidase [Deltaproteobacteria bacterium]|nr:M48 family metallopeptidase [Deltaproteobacteria bacterium]
MAALALAVYLLLVVLDAALRALNLSHLRRHGQRVPPGFERAIDGALLARTSDYTLARGRLALIESLLVAALVALFLFGGPLEWYDRTVAAGAPGFVTGGLLFFGGLAVASTLLGLPFDALRTFGIERRFGFSTTTLRVWIGDLAKGLLISLLLTGGLATGGLWLVLLLPGWWWLAVWSLFLGMSVLLVFLAPVLIEPLFNQYQPIADPALDEGIRALAARAGVGVSRILKMDASRRSRHSNAYFAGLGRVKRVVLFDTLLEQLAQAEVLAVLAHELGHWRQRHVLKRMVVYQAAALLACAGAWWLTRWPGVPALVGAAGLSFYGRLAVVAFVGSLLSSLLGPLGNAWSRSQERQADAAAVALSGGGGALRSALIKLAAENLSNLHPHPLFAAVHYSHPPVVERVQSISGGR